MNRTERLYPLRARPRPPSRLADIARAAVQKVFAVMPEADRIAAGAAAGRLRFITGIDVLDPRDGRIAEVWSITDARTFGG